jgi:predicted MFS family arabinose efflux permease
MLLGAIPLAWAAGVLSLPLLLAIVAGYGTASLVNDAASMSFLPRLVPREQLQRAHARVDRADAVAQTTGPVLAGLLIKVLGAPLAVLVDSLTYLFSAATVWSLRTPDRKPTGSCQRPNLRLEIGEGVRWVYRGSGLARLAVATHVWFAANAVIGTVVAPFALVELGLSPLQFGVTTALGGVGGILGATLSGAGGRRLGTGGAVITAHLFSVVAACVLALAGLGASGWWAVTVLGLGQALHGFGLVFSNSHEMSYRQALTPDSLQARTNTTMRAFNRPVVVLAAPLGGLLAVRAGTRSALLVAAGVFLLAAVILAASPFRKAQVAPDNPNPTGDQT